MMRANQRSTMFMDMCNLIGLTQHVQQTTRGDNTLDLVLSTQLQVEAVAREGVFESDHAEIICTVHTMKYNVPLVNRTTAYNYKRADFDGLRTSLHVIPWCILDDMPVDDAVDLFYCLLESAIADFIPVVHVKRKFPPWFDRNLRAALLDKERAHKQMKRVGNVQSVAEFGEKRRFFKNLSSSKYKEYLVSLTADFRTNPKRFWSFLKCLKGGKKGLSVLRDGGVDVCCVWEPYQ